MTKDVSPAARSKIFDTLLALPLPRLGQALEEVRLGADRFCLLAGIETLQAMMEEDATALCGPGAGLAIARSIRPRPHRCRKPVRTGLSRAARVGSVAMA